VESAALGELLARAVAGNTPTSGPWSEAEIRIDVLHAAGLVRLWHAQEARGVPASRRLGLARLPSWKAFALRWNMPTTTAARRLRAACESLGIADDAKEKWFARGSPVVRPWCDGGSPQVGTTPNIEPKRFVGGVRVVRRWCGRGITRGPKSYQEVQEDQKEHIDARPALALVPAPDPSEKPADPKPRKAKPSPSADVLTAWAAYRVHHPQVRDVPPKGWGVADRVKDHGVEAVVAVVEWAHTSAHKRAVFLREGGYTGETLFRASKFPEYVSLAGQQQPARLSAMPAQDPTDAAWLAIVTGAAHMADTAADLRDLTTAADRHGWTDEAAEAYLGGDDSRAERLFKSAHRSNRPAVALGSDSSDSGPPGGASGRLDGTMPF
jgi:hypothetical protein